MKKVKNILLILCVVGLIISLYGNYILRTELDSEILLSAEIKKNNSNLKRLLDSIEYANDSLEQEIIDNKTSVDSLSKIIDNRNERIEYLNTKLDEKFIINDSLVYGEFMRYVTNFRKLSDKPR